MIYKVVVQASDGATMAPHGWFKVTVDGRWTWKRWGSIKLRPTGPGNRQPCCSLRLEVEITAYGLTDPDGMSADARSTSAIAAATYKWYRTSSRTVDGDEDQDRLERCNRSDRYLRGPGQAIAMSASYLRVVATYTDGRPSARRQDRHGGFAIQNNWPDRSPTQRPSSLRQVRCESGARGNAKGDGHRHPNHSHRRGQRREIDLLADQ